MWLLNIFQNHFLSKWYIFGHVLPQPMVLMTERSWQDLGSLLGGAGYTNCYSPSQYDSKDSLSEGTHQTDTGIRKCEESLKTPTEATSAPSGPSGLVIFGRMVQKHSYVSGLIIMMVNILSTHLIEGSSVCHLLSQTQKISKIILLEEKTWLPVQVKCLIVYFYSL